MNLIYSPGWLLDLEDRP